MKRRKTYITLGILTATTPLLSFPSFIETIIIIFLSLWISFMAFFENRGNGNASKKKKKQKEKVITVNETEDEKSDQ